MNDGKGTTTACPICGKEFHRRVKGQVFCSKSCAGKGRSAKVWKEKTREWGVCRVCGKSLEGCKGRKTYCSDGCAEIGMKEVAKKARHMSRYRHICPQCGKEFAAKEQNRKYCSVPCKQAGMKISQEATRARQADGTDDRGETVLVLIVRPVAVKREMAPKVGQIYAAVRYRGFGPETIVIPEIGKYGLIVRKDEVKIIEGRRG